jgi:WD40 repeat protein
MEIEQKAKGKYMIWQSIEFFTKAVRSISTLDDYLLISTYNNKAKVFLFDKKTSKYNPVCDLELSEEFVFATHIYKREGDYYFAFAGKDKNIYVCNNEGDPVNTVTNAHTDSINCIISSEKHLVTGAWDGAANVYDIDSLELLHECTSPS